MPPRSPAVAGSPYLDGLGEIEKRGAEIPLWLLLTDEPLLEADFAAKLLARVVTANPDFNQQRLDVTRDSRAVACQGFAEEFPIGSTHRLLWLRGAEKYDDAEKAKLAEYVAAAPASTVFLISMAPRTEATPASAEGGDDAGGKTGGRTGHKKLLEVAARLGRVINGQLEAAQLMGWLEKELDKQGVKSTVEARKVLLERVGEDLAALRSEAGKLACYVAERGRLEAGDVRLMVAASPEHKIFEISNAIAEGDVSSALTVLAEMLDADEHPLMLLGYLTSYFRGLIKMKALRERRESIERIAAMLNKKTWSVEKDMRLLDRMSMGDLERAIEALLRADHAIKSGKDPRFLMDLLTLTLCRFKPDAGSRMRKESPKSARTHGY